MSTTDNFWKAVAEFEPPEIRPIFWRLYYNEKTGEPVEYTMQEREGTYIDITPAQFAAADQMVRVIDGELRKVSLLSYGTLVPAKSGFPVHKSDISLVDPNSDAFMEMESYEQID